MNSIYINENSDVQSQNIGSRTRVWQYCVILPNAVIGEDCNICSHVLIENNVVIGDRVTVKSGVQLWDGVRISDDVFIGPNVSFTNDIFPRSRKQPEKYLVTKIEHGASIGANSTLLPGICIGANAMIGAGAVVTKDVPSNAVVVGNPAAIIGYSNTSKDQASDAVQPIVDNRLEKVALDVGGCTLYQLPLAGDIRGTLSVAEIEKHIPFEARRVFWVYDVPSKEVRGEHAHKNLHQYLVCVKGSVAVVVDDGFKRREIELNQPNTALYIPPKVWGIQYKYSKESVLLVLASDIYDPTDYIRDYSEFLKFVSIGEN